MGSQWTDWNRRVMWSHLHFFPLQDEASTTVLKAMESGSRKTRKENIAEIKVRQNKWGDQFHCDLSGKILPDRADFVKLLVTGFGGLIDEGLHRQCAVKVFDWEWDCDVIKLKEMEVILCACVCGSDEHCFCPLTIQLKFVLWHPDFLYLNNSQMWFSKASGCF